MSLRMRYTLNHSSSSSDIFLYLHRKRSYDPKQSYTSTLYSFLVFAIESTEFFTSLYEICPWFTNKERDD